MPEQRTAEAEPHRFAEVAAGPKSGQHLDLANLRTVRLRITVELGEARMLVREIISLRVGSIVQLSKMAGELTDIRANGLQLGKGEVVVIGDALHVRIAEIEGAQEQIDEMLAAE
jgi:flagellar motor switch protein FliN/FliY